MDFSQCVPQISPFSQGEKLYYNAYYKLSFIWLNAGEVSFSYTKKQIDNKNYSCIDVSGGTYPGYDWIFKIRDHFLTIIDPVTLLPLSSIRKTSEGGYDASEKYIFNYKEKSIYSSVENSKKPLTLDTLALPNCLFDLLSAVYYCRSIDFTKYKINDRIPVKVIVDGKMYNLFIKNLGKEVIQSRETQEYLRCIKISITLISGTVFNEGEEMLVWLSDDNSRIPIQVQADIIVGSVMAVFKNAEGLKYPISCKVNKTD